MKKKEIEFEIKKHDTEKNLKEKEENNEKIAEKLRQIIMKLKKNKNMSNNSISSSSTINSQNKNSGRGNPVEIPI